MCLEHSCVLILHIRQLLLLQGCCLEGLVQVLAWTHYYGIHILLNICWFIIMQLHFLVLQAETHASHGEMCAVMFDKLLRMFAHKTSLIRPSDV